MGGLFSQVMSNILWTFTSCPFFFFCNTNNNNLIRPPQPLLPFSGISRLVCKFSVRWSDKQTIYRSTVVLSPCASITLCLYLLRIFTLYQLYYMNIHRDYYYYCYLPDVRPRRSTIFDDFQFVRKRRDNNVTSYGMTIVAPLKQFSTHTHKRVYQMETCGWMVASSTTYHELLASGQEQDTNRLNQQDTTIC